MDVRALASVGFTLVQRYGVDISRALGVLALLGAPGTFRLLLIGRAYAWGIAAGVYALLLGASLWTGRVGSEARRTAALDPAGAPEPSAGEWWRPALVQQYGVEIAKALAALAILGCPGALCLSAMGRRPYVVGLVYLLLWGGVFWSSAVGSEARRIAAQRAAAWAAQAAAQAALTRDPGAPGGPTTTPVFGTTSPAPPPISAHTDAMQGPAMVAVGCGGIGLVAGLVLLVVSLLAFALLAYVCLILLYGLGHGQPPSWLP